MLKRLLLTSVIALPSISYAQMVGAEAFMQGTFVEVGVNTCGAYGTIGAAPAGFHPTNFGMGFVADADMDGWSVGSPPYCGDYFLPGSPVEGWNLRFNGGTYMNTDQWCWSATVPGAVVSYTSSAGTMTIVWQGLVSGMTVTQETVLNTADLYFRTNITLCNTTGSTMTDVYYGRNVDPDNDVMWPGGSFTTTNTVVSQPSAGTCDPALVTAVGYTGCYLGLASTDSRARACYGGFSTEGDPLAYYTPYWPHMSSGTSTNDEAISIGFSLGNLAPGACVNFNFVYILDPSALGDALSGVSVDVEADGVNITGSPVTPLCNGDPDVTLGVRGVDGFTINWSPGTGLSSTSDSTVLANPSTTTTYTVTGSKVVPCGTLTFTKNITVVVDNSVVNAGPDVTICPGANTTLSPTYTGLPLPPPYICYDDYDVASVPYNFLTSGSATSFYPNSSVAIPIGFNFSFYCSTYNQLYVSPNGFASFSPTVDGWYPSPLPTTWTGANNLIAFAWGYSGLDLSMANVSYFTTGTAPNRTFVLTFANAMHAFSYWYWTVGPPFTVQMQLHETSNTVDIHIQNFDYDDYFIQGIQDEGTVNYDIVPCRNSWADWTCGYGFSAYAEAWRFTPVTTTFTLYSWSPSTGLSDPFALSPIASPGSTTTYTLTINNGVCLITDDVTVNVGCVLSADMLEFKAIKENNRSKLYWTTANEENLDHFVVERSTDGYNFSEIGKVNAAGAGAGSHSYTFEDKSPVMNLNYYRLRLVDTDGTMTMSETATLNYSPELKNQLLRVYPNPSQGKVKMDVVTAFDTQEFTLKVFNTMGALVAEHSNRLGSAGFYAEEIDLSKLSVGMYFYQVEIGTEVYDGKLSIEK